MTTDARFPPPRRLVPATTVRSSDGVDVAAYRLSADTGRPGTAIGGPVATGPGQGAPILAAHATGFCAAVLAPLAEHLGPVPVVAFDERGHGASGRPGSGSFAWEGFADDVLAVVDAFGLDRPLGFGHSCGGAALVLAEVARPGTFSGLYLFEPVIPPLDDPVPGGVPDNPLSVGARRRRSTFASRREALGNFAAKPPFDRLDRRALAAYVDNGFRPSADGGITLCCERLDEAAVYAGAFAHHAYARLPEVRCPVTVACGADTDAFSAGALAPVVDRLPTAELLVLPGLGHFGPLQDPPAVAASLVGSLAWAAASPAAGTPSP